MKKVINIIAITLLMLGVYSCEYDIDNFSAKNSNVSFTVSSSSIAEQSTGTVKIPLVLAGINGSGEVIVNIAVDTGSSDAIEGTDFIIESGKSYTFSDGAGIQYIEVSPVDNDVLTGDKTVVFVIESTSKALKENSATSAILTIVDDEHPLKAFLGTYTVAVSSGFGLSDYTFDVEISTDAEDITKLWIANWYLAPYNLTCPEKIYMMVDQEAGTITIPTPQTLGDPGYGVSTLYMWDFSTDDSAEGDLIGTIGEDYSITMSTDYGIASVITEGANEGYWIGAQYNITWTKN